MNKAKWNYYDAIQVLQVEQNASPEEIRIAYRKLAKRYHPDVYRNDGGAQFKLINSAYQFLKEHPSPPAAKQSATQNRKKYANDSASYEKRRAAYYRQQEEKKVAARIQKEKMFSWLFARLKLFAFIILIFNGLLAIDYLLPSVAEEVTVKDVNAIRFYSKYSTKNVPATRYTLKLSNGANFRAGKQTEGIFELSKRFELKRSQIFHEVHSIVNEENGTVIHNEYGIFRVFGVLIPISILLLLGYLFYINNNDYRLTVFLVTVLIFIVQLVLLVF